jgi:cellulose synthase/poly-beta-1,6-N-acetylglucosamine synthase-like glycosyltransferase
MIRGPVFLAQAALAVMDTYLLGLLAAAMWPARNRWPAGRSPRTRFAVLVPAHDEEDGLGVCLAALAASDYPRERFRVVVVADNCTDRTAAVGRDAGAIVIERDDPDRRGKGHALNWALDHLERLDWEYDAVAFVDADCQVSRGFLATADRALQAGERAVQAAYVVANPGESPTADLRFAAFALLTMVRPAGKERLGLSCGLFGTGMAFNRDLIERLRFDTASVVEDADLHARFVAEGGRVAFVPEAQVRSAMPNDPAASRAQQTRWEGGRRQLVRRFCAPLLFEGVRRRDPVRIHAALELLVPPQSILAMLHALAGLCSMFDARARRIAAVSMAAHTLFVFGGLRLAAAPSVVYRSLTAAPMLVAQKLRIFGRMAVTGGPTTWERTARESSGSSA